LLDAFLQLAAKKLKLGDWLAGYDDHFLDPHMYYEVGAEWTPVAPDYRIPYSILCTWMYSAGNKIDWSDRTCRIPMQVIAEEVEKLYPGRWKGEFQLETQGVRFWDPSADHPRGCIVRESGMQCFTGEFSFRSWADIFGREFVSKYEEKQIGEITSGTYTDGKEYWLKDIHGRWVHWCRDDFKTYLRVHYKLRGGGGKKGDSSSEVEKVTTHILVHNLVEASLPYIHKPEGPIVDNGRTFLNVSTARCMTPVDQEVTKWGDGFPWVAEFIDEFFEAPQQEQKDTFLSWLSHFYCNARLQTPRPGHAIFIVGATGIGKTLLCNRIVAPMVGGMADGSDLLVGNGRWTAPALSQPVMTVDDAPSIVSDSVKHYRYSAMVKKIVANRELVYEEKFQKIGRVTWLGRIVVTCNTDSNSIKLLPDMELGILDKIMLFKCNDGVDRDFPEDSVLEGIISRELPFFCRWLINYVIPPQCISPEKRYHVKPFHHPTLYSHALQSATCYSFFELIQMFLIAWSTSTGKSFWTGNASKLLSDMCADEGLRALSVKYTANQVAGLLGQLKSRGYPMERSRGHNCGRSWVIPVKLEAPESDVAQRHLELEEEAAIEDKS
jgi:hypothetical protein